MCPFRHLVSICFCRVKIGYLDIHLCNSTGARSIALCSSVGETLADLQTVGCWPLGGHHLQRTAIQDNIPSHSFSTEALYFLSVNKRSGWQQTLLLPLVSNSSSPRRPGPICSSCEDSPSSSGHQWDLRPVRTDLPSSSGRRWNLRPEGGQEKSGAVQLVASSWITDILQVMLGVCFPCSE